MLLDYFARKENLSFKASKKDYFYALGESDSSPFVLIKPSTYVNLSGTAAKNALAQFGIEIEDLLVVCDDINLQTAQLRIKPSGGDGGHNGVSSIIYHLESDKFPRLRFGIGRNFQPGQMADYVLSPFSKDEFALLEQSFESGSQLLKAFISGGLKSALDYYSKSQKDSKPADTEARKSDQPKTVNPDGPEPKASGPLKPENPDTH